MADIYVPILPLQLDPRNTPALVRDMQTKIFLASQGQLNDFSPASPLSALVEGQAYAQSELLYYLNALPEAYTLQWLRQLGIQRSIGAKAAAEVTFTKTSGFTRTVIIPAGTIVSTANRLNFVLKNEVKIGDSLNSASGIVSAEKWGTAYNVPALSIEKINVNILGLNSVTNNAAAQGGKDLESIETMKSKAFSLLRRRGLISAEDYENELRILAPDASIIKVLTYEEMLNINSESTSGIVVVCVGDQDGKELQQSIRQDIVKSFNKKVPLGTSVSLMSPTITPIETSVSIEYDDSEYSGGLGFYASQINTLLTDRLNPQTIDLGGGIDYQEVFNEIYELDVVNKIKSLSIKLLQIVEGNDVQTPADCNFPFLSEEIDGICVDTPEAVLDSIDASFVNTNPIRSFRVYKNIISLIASSTQSPITFTFINEDYAEVLGA